MEKETDVDTNKEKDTDMDKDTDTDKDKNFKKNMVMNYRNVGTSLENGSHRMLVVGLLYQLASKEQKDSPSRYIKRLPFR